MPVQEGQLHSLILLQTDKHKPKPINLAKPPHLMMALSTSTTPTTALITVFLLLIVGDHPLHGSSTTAADSDAESLPKGDKDLLDFALNLEYLEADFFAWSSLGQGVDTLEPNLTMGGPPPVGVQRANLGPGLRNIIEQFAYQELGHLRAIQSTSGGFPRPLLDLSAASFATVMNNAFGGPVIPPFDPYANDINFLLACYVLPYVGMTGYVGSSPQLQSPVARRVNAGLLGLESGQDAIVRTLLSEFGLKPVLPYGFTVAQFTNRISNLRNYLGREGLKDEGLIVFPEQGADGRISTNILSADTDSLYFGRTPEEILRIVYGSGSENIPGLFFPHGAGGDIARSYL